MGNRIWKKITYEEFHAKTKDLNELQYAFSDYRKSLIVPPGLGILGSSKYIENNVDSAKPDEFEYYKADGYRRDMILGNHAYEAFKSAIDYYKKNNNWE